MWFEKIEPNGWLSSLCKQVSENIGGEVGFDTNSITCQLPTRELVQTFCGSPIKQR